MRIIKLPDIMRMQSLDNSEKTAMALLDGADAELSTDGVVFSGYGEWFWSRRTVDYKDRHYRIEVNDGVVPDAALIESGDCRLVDDEGVAANFPAIAQEQLILSDGEKYRSRLRFGDMVSGVKFDMSTFDTVTTLTDLLSGKSTTNDRIDIGGSMAQLLDNHLIGFEQNSRQLTCVDTNLETIWSYEADQNILPEYVVGPFVEDGVVIISFGPSSVTQVSGDLVDGIQYAAKKQHHDALLVAVDLETG